MPRLRRLRVFVGRAFSDGLTFMAGQSHAPRSLSFPAVGGHYGFYFLGGFGLNALFPVTSTAAGRGDALAAAAPSGELAAYRPVAVSSTDYAPTPASSWSTVSRRPGVREADGARRRGTIRSGYRSIFRPTAR